MTQANLPNEPEDQNSGGRVIEQENAVSRSKTGHEQKYRRGRRIAAGGVIVLTLLAIWGIQGYLSGDKPANPLVAKSTPVLSISAKEESDAGISTKTAFIIQTGDPTLSAETLESGLSITPATAFGLSKSQDGQFILRPDAPLEPDSIYRLSYLSASGGASFSEGSTAAEVLTWAFQTEGDFKVVSSMPANEVASVPLETGVELTLSRTCGDVGGFFSIEPAVKGRFEYHGKTALFVPDSPLMADTVYTVTLKSGLKSDAGHILGEDYSFSFRTKRDKEGPGGLYLECANGLTEVFLTGDAVPIELTGYYSSAGNSALDGAAFSVGVYRLNDGAQYLDLASEHASRINPYLGRPSDYLLDTSALPTVSSFEATLNRANDYSTCYIVLPENPGAGYYLIDMRSEDPAVGQKALQKLICVSDLSVYVQSENGRSLVWLNDAAAGGALGGASVSISCGETKAGATTGADGLAALEVSSADGQRARLFIRTGDGRTCADLVAISQTQERPPNYDYYSYIYFDREAYLPTDTARFWGFLSPREKGVSLPTGLTLSIPGLPAQKIELNLDGTFSGAFAFENLRSTYYDATLMSGDKTIQRRYIRVMEYIKPAYVIDATLDRPYYYRRDEPVNAAVSAKFFDGTPATGLALEGFAPSFSSTAVTDELGNASFRFPGFSGQLRYGWSPFYDYAAFRTNGREDGDTYLNRQFVRFPTDYMLEASIVGEDGGFRLETATHRIDFSKVDALFEGGAFNPYDDRFEDSIRGPAYSQALNVSVVKCEYIRREVGSYYDFIRKETVKTYTYDFGETPVEDFFAVTGEGGVYRSGTLPYTGDPLFYYKVVLCYVTPDGATVEMSLYPDRNISLYNNDRKYFSLRPDSYSYETGSDISVRLLDKDGRTPGEGRLLYSVFKDRLLDRGVTSEAGFTLRCTETHIPNITIYGAYFDGRYIYPVYGPYLSYKPDERRLTLTIETDKPSYRPGETVTASIKAVDRQNRPQEASFVLSVADEAAFAVEEQVVNILPEVYHPVYYPSVSTYVSYVQHSALGEGGAEKGGEGDASGVRDNFLDTAAFVTGKTSADGTATVTFSLPDNLTSWRLTGVAMTKDVLVGHTTSNAVVTIPFFINQIVNDKYVFGDEVVLSVRSAGQAVGAFDHVAYSVTVKGDGVEETRSLNAPAGQHAYFSFGYLANGEYTLRTEAAFGPLRDIVERQFLVVDSLLEVPVTAYTGLDGVKDLASVKYPVTLYFYDTDSSLYMNALTRLNAAAGDRADERLARTAAYEKLLELSPDSVLYLDRPNLSDIQDWNGGVKLLPYADTDVLLTAKAAAAAGHLISTPAAVDYFYRVVYNRQSAASEVAAAYMGLAAAKEPVLLDIRRLLAGGALLNLQDRLCLATGLALLGDMQGALHWYDENLAPLAIRNNPWIGLKTPDGGVADYQLTAKGAELAYRAGHKDAAGLLTFILQNRSDEYLPLLELIGYVEASPAPANSMSSFTYTLDGQTVTADLSKTPVHAVRMGKAQLEAANFRQASGNIGVTARYTAGADRLALDSTGKIGVSKRYEVINGGAFGSGELVRVTIGVNFEKDAPVDAYTVTDVLPSGLRYVHCEYAYNENWYLADQDAGRVTFTVNRIKRNYAVENSRPEILSGFKIVYYARCAVPGTYIADSVVVRHARSELCAAGVRSQLTVTP